MKLVFLCLILISCASRNSQHTCEVKSHFKNKTLHWTLTGTEISIPDTQFFIQKSDKSWEAFTARFKIDPESEEYTYRYVPQEGDMSGPVSFSVESSRPITLVARIPLLVEPLKVELPKTVCSK